MIEVMQTPQKLWPSNHLWENYLLIWDRLHLGRLLINSTIVALGVSLGKIAISILPAFAIVYFNFRGKQLFFWMVLITLMLPVQGLLESEK
jgi:sn-glycerol 3-phosphate transport system permease protein